MHSFFLYTFPDSNSSELFVKADLEIPLGNITAKLLYFLDLELNNGKLVNITEYYLFYSIIRAHADQSPPSIALCIVTVGFGAGVFIDIDKEAALRLKPKPTPGAATKPTSPTGNGKPTHRPSQRPTSRPTSRRPTSRKPTSRRPTSIKPTAKATPQASTTTTPLPATCSSESSETATLLTHGRISRDDFKKIVNKKDLFQICATAAGGLIAEGASVGISLPPEDNVVNKFIPKLVIDRIDAIVKKDVNIGSTSVKPGRKMYETDRRRLEGLIGTDSHRALRMLCETDALPEGFRPVCPVQDNGYACAKLSNIDIDMGELKNMVDNVLGKLVVPNYKSNGLSPGYFDEIGSKLLILDDQLPGVSDLAGRR
jgi:hypothetical protein